MVAKKTHEGEVCLDRCDALRLLVDALQLLLFLRGESCGSFCDGSQLLCGLSLCLRCAVFCLFMTCAWRSIDVSSANCVCSCVTSTSRGLSSASSSNYVASALAALSAARSPGGGRPAFCGGSLLVSTAPSGRLRAACERAPNCACNLRTCICGRWWREEGAVNRTCRAGMSFFRGGAPHPCRFAHPTLRALHDERAAPSRGVRAGACQGCVRHRCVGLGR